MPTLFIKSPQITTSPLFLTYGDAASFNNPASFDTINARRSFSVVVVVSLSARLIASTTSDTHRISALCFRPLRVRTTRTREPKIRTDSNASPKLFLVFFVFLSFVVARVHPPSSSPLSSSPPRFTTPLTSSPKVFSFPYNERETTSP